MKSKRVEVATALTLGDMFGMTQLMGDVEIINECNETLIIASYVEDNVVSLDKVLSHDLLNRELMSYGVRDNRAVFKVKGMEDAE